MTFFDDENDSSTLESNAKLNVDISVAHPRQNPYLIGHEKVIEKFLTNWHSDFFHPVHLISGASGIGKATLAYHIARYVLSGSKTKNTLETDFNSVTCRQIANNAHPNLMVLEPGLPTIGDSGYDKTISVKWVRKMIDYSHHKATLDGWRVYIIDKADNMQAGAINATLKILEEPPEKSLFLIICDAPYNLPPPVRSRCQNIYLSPLTTEQVHEFLQLADLESDPLTLESLAQLSNGGLGQALTWWKVGAITIYDEFINCLNASFDKMPPSDDLFTLAQRIADQERAEEKKSEQNIGNSFQIFASIVNDYLTKAIFAFSTKQIPTPIRPEVDKGIIQKIMQTEPNVENWLNLKTLLQHTAKRALPPLHLEKQQTVLEILWRIRYACQANWKQALRKTE